MPTYTPSQYPGPVTLGGETPRILLPLFNDADAPTVRGHLNSENLTLDDNFASLDEGLSALDDHITTIDDEIATNAEEIATLVTDVADNTANIATNTEEIATLVTDVADNTANIATNTAEIATLVTDVADNTANIATNTADIANLVTDVTENTTDISTVSNQITTVIDSVTTLSTQVASNVIGLQNLEGKTSTDQYGVTVTFTGPFVSSGQRNQTWNTTGAWGGGPIFYTQRQSQLIRPGTSPAGPDQRMIGKFNNFSLQVMALGSSSVLPTPATSAYQVMTLSHIDGSPLPWTISPVWPAKYMQAANPHTIYDGALIFCNTVGAYFNFNTYYPNFVNANDIIDGTATGVTPTLGGVYMHFPTMPANFQMYINDFLVSAYCEFGYDSGINYPLNTANLPDALDYPSYLNE